MRSIEAHAVFAPSKADEDPDKVIRFTQKIKTESGKYRIPAVHVRDHVNLGFCLRNLLLRRDLGFLTEEHGHFGGLFFSLFPSVDL